MDTIFSSILGYVETFDSSLDTSDDLTLLICEDVRDRVLTYTNRTQLIEDYEDALELNPSEDDITPDGAVFGTPCPIPPQLERAIARIIVNTYRTFNARQDATEKEVKKITDNGQSIEYGDNLQSFLDSVDETELFAGSITILDKFRLPDVVENI